MTIVLQVDVSHRLLLSFVIIAVAVVAVVVVIVEVEMLNIRLIKSTHSK